MPYTPSMTDTLTIIRSVQTGLCKNNILKEDLRMANETLKAGFDKYMAGVEAKLAKKSRTCKP